MVPLGCRFAFAVAFLISLLQSQAALGAEPAPPSDTEITRFIAVENGLVTDPGRAEAVCAALRRDRESDEGSQDLAVIGRKVEADPIFGPLVRRQGLTGRRFAEISAQIAGALLGLGMADSMDAAERAKGKPAKNREVVLQRSPEARSVAPRQAELVAALEAVDALCGESEEDEEPEDGGEG